MSFFVTLAGHTLDMLKMVWHMICIAASYWYISLAVIVFIVLLPFAVRLVVALISRAVFSAKLSAAVKKRGGTCRFLRCPIVSLFLNYSADDISVTLDGENLTVKFFPKNVRARNVYLNRLEHAYVSRPFAQNLAGHGRYKGEHLKSDNIMNKGEGKRRKLVLKLNKPENGKYILLFEAAPYNVWSLNKNQYIESGSGAVIDGVTLYVGKEFLNCINR